MPESGEWQAKDSRKGRVPLSKMAPAYVTGKFGSYPRSGAIFRFALEPACPVSGRVLSFLQILIRLTMAHSFSSKNVD